ncbi:MAG: ribonuclease E inhibitor RraB [Burkholderiaceae bacterium]
MPLTRPLAALLIAATALAAPAAVTATPAARGHTGADMADMQTLEALRRQGDDLGRPHDVRYFSNFPDEASAKAARKDLVGAGFTAVHSAAAGKSQPWVLVLARKMTLSIDNVRAASAAMSAAAAKHGGRYDGWEARPIAQR